MSKVIQLGIYVIELGNREFSIYTHWRGFRADFPSEGLVAYGAATDPRAGDGSGGRVLVNFRLGRTGQLQEDGSV